MSNYGVMIVEDDAMPTDWMLVRRERGKDVVVLTETASNDGTVWAEALEAAMAEADDQVVQDGHVVLPTQRRRLQVVR